jgi:phage I-like protein
MRDGRLSPSQREWAIGYCHADPSGFATFIAKQSPLLAIASKTGGSEVHPIRETGPGSAGSGKDAAAARLSPIESAVCARLGIKPIEYVAKKPAAANWLAFD